MLQPKEFQYILEVPAIAEYELQHAPAGWLDDTEVMFKRSEKYFGMVRSLTVPLKFTLDGAAILRSRFYDKGVQALVYLRINKLDPSTWTYLPAYYGKIDFSTAEDERDYFTVNAKDADMSLKIKAFENVKYEIPMDDENAIDVQITPIKLVEKAEFIFTPSEPDPLAAGYMGLQLVNNEVKASKASAQEVEYRATNTFDFNTADDWFFRATTATNVKIKINDLAGVVSKGLDTESQFKISIAKSGAGDVLTLFNLTPESFLGFNVDNYEQTIAVGAGEKLFIYQDYNNGNAFEKGFVIGAEPIGEMTIEYETETPPSLCKAFRPKYVFEQLIKKMNGGFNYPVQSFLLDEWQQLTITCGDAIRQIPGAKLKLSFTDFYKSINALLSTGHAVENGTATIERKSSFYRNFKAIDLPDAKDVKITPATDLMYNSFKVGYADQKYDEINGRDEVNSQQNYVVDVTEPQRELDLMSVIRADAYGIEFLRINLEGKNSTDSDSDNDAFFIYVKPQPEDGETYYQPLPADTITGVSAGTTYYNWIISPSRNLRRHGAYIRSIFFGGEGYQIRFASALKNTAMVATYNGTGYQEGVNINISELDAPFFMPFYAELTTDLPNDVWKFINTGVYGYAKFPYIGHDLTGYAIEVSTDLAKNSEREFKFLLKIGNTFAPLVRPLGFQVLGEPL